MANTVELKFPDRVAWTPQDDITVYELARAMPVLFAIAEGPASAAERVRCLASDVARHFTVTPNPLNR